MRSPQLGVELSRHRTRLAAADRPPVEPHNGHHVGRRAREEQLRDPPEVAGGDRLFLGGELQLLDQLQHDLPRDARQDARTDGMRPHHAVEHKEDIRVGALGHDAVAYLDGVERVGPGGTLLGQDVGEELDRLQVAAAPPHVLH